MTQEELENKLIELGGDLDLAYLVADQSDPNPIEVTRIAQDMDHYRQRLINVRAGYGDTAVLRSRVPALTT